MIREGEIQTITDCGQDGLRGSVLQTTLKLHFQIVFE